MLDAIESRFDKEHSIAIGVAVSYLLLTIGSIVAYFQIESYTSPTMIILLLTVVIGLSGLSMFWFLQSYQIESDIIRNRLMLLISVGGAVLLNIPPHILNFLEAQQSGELEIILSAFLANILLISIIIWTIFYTFSKREIGVGEMDDLEEN